MIPCKNCGAARTATCKPGCGKTRTYREPDDVLRARVLQRYGLLGDTRVHVETAIGEALDVVAKHLGLERIVVEVPIMFDGETI